MDWAEQFELKYFELCFQLNNFQPNILMKCQCTWKYLNFELLQFSSTGLVGGIANLKGYIWSEMFELFADWKSD